MGKKNKKNKKIPGRKKSPDRSIKVVRYYPYILEDILEQLKDLNLSLVEIFQLEEIMIDRNKLIEQIITQNAAGEISEQLKVLNTNLKEIHSAQMARNKIIEQVLAQDAGKSDSPSPGEEKINLDPKPEEDPGKGKKKKASGKAIRDKTYKKPDSDIVQ